MKQYHHIVSFSLHKEISFKKFLIISDLAVYKNSGVSDFLAF
jgi:hypothetical protein